MAISWYSIAVSIQNVGGGNTVVNYYFSVDTTTNIITGFYSYNNIGVNTLFSVPPSPPEFTTNAQQATKPPFWTTADNIFNTSTLLFSINNGMNYSDTYLPQQPLRYETFQNVFTVNHPLFSFYSNGTQNYLWGYSAERRVLSNSIIIQSISEPPSPNPTSPIPCFLEGSTILTDKGYKPIQILRKGDLVKTLKDDYKMVAMIGKREIYHPAIQERVKDQLYKCSKDNFDEIIEPLIITGCHSILVDKFTDEEEKQKVIEVNGNTYVTDNKYRLPACADSRTSIYETPGTYTIYHLALEHEDYCMNYGVYANGLLVESCSIDYLENFSDMILIE